MPKDGKLKRNNLIAQPKFSLHKMSVTAQMIAFCMTYDITPENFGYVKKFGASFHTALKLSEACPKILVVQITPSGAWYCAKPWRPFGGLIFFFKKHETPTSQFR